MSGFCNDLQDFSQIYWLCENFNGMTDDELQEFLVKLNLYHIAGADTSEGGKITPYTNEIPVTARQALLELLHTRCMRTLAGWTCIASARIAPTTIWMRPMNR